jgi:hypothetical protein
MSIDLYPPFIKEDDLSPDKAFGAEIDEDCEVRPKSFIETDILLFWLS